MITRHTTGAFAARNNKFWLEQCIYDFHWHYLAICDYLRISRHISCNMWFTLDIFSYLCVYIVISNKMTRLWTNHSLTFTFYVTISNCIPKRIAFVLDLMLSLERDKLTALWQNNSLTSTVYVIFSNSIQN